MIKHLKLLTYQSCQPAVPHIQSTNIYYKF